MSTRLRNIVSAPQSTAASFVRREFKRHLFVVDSLNEQIQNKKELIRLASAGMGGLFLIFVESILTWRLDLFADLFSAKFADFEYITNKV